MVNEAATVSVIGRVPHSCSSAYRVIQVRALLWPSWVRVNVEVIEVLGCCC